MPPLASRSRVSASLIPAVNVSGDSPISLARRGGRAVGIQQQRPDPKRCPPGRKHGSQDRIVEAEDAEAANSQDAYLGHIVGTLANDVGDRAWFGVHPAISPDKATMVGLVRAGASPRATRASSGMWRNSSAMSPTGEHLAHFGTFHAQSGMWMGFGRMSRWFTAYRTQWYRCARRR